MTPAMRGHLAMLIWAAGVAGSFSLGQRVANEISPLALNAVRFWLAVVLLGAMVRVSGDRINPRLGGHWRYAILGAIFAFYFITMFEGLKTASSVSIAAVLTLTPIMSAAFGWLLLRQLVTSRMALALALGGIGALWVIFRADIEAFLALDLGRGELIFFFGCLAHAFYTPFGRKVNRGEASLVYTFWVLVYAACVASAAGLFALLETDWSGLSPLVWVTIGYTALIATAMTASALLYAAMRLPSAKVMAYTYLTPSLVIVWELALGGQPPAALVLAGFVLTVIALLLLLRE